MKIDCETTDRSSKVNQTISPVPSCLAAVQVIYFALHVSRWDLVSIKYLTYRANKFSSNVVSVILISMFLAGCV